MWHSLPNFSKYEINENGIVRNIKTGNNLKVRLCKGERNPKGYYVFDMYNDNSKKKSLKRSRLLAFAFIPNPTNLPEVDHIDENTHNDSLNNLQWISRVDNHLKSVEACSNGNYWDKETISKVSRYLDKGLTGKEIYKLTGVSQATISRIRNEGSTTSRKA